MANEKRLIDANAEIRKMRDALAKNKRNRRHLVYWVFDAVISVLEKAPTVDAVEVVRCKDCIGKAHWYKNNYGCTICGVSGLFVVEDRDFCSYGERREGE